ncbi:MAG: heat-inducible transcriptional repressor HrcA [bacterium]
MIEELTEREKFILEAIIRQYIGMAEPIGSRTISKKINLPLSPATIRNIMADLEEKGYLQHPHTSAGRIPTDQGYRYYVDNLLKSSSRKKSRKTGLEPLSKIHEREELMEGACRLLSLLSKYVGIVIPPKITDLRMKRMDFIPLSSHRILAVFVSETGLVYNKIIEAREPYTERELNMMNQFINERYQHMNIVQIRDKLMEVVSEEGRLYKNLFDNINLLSEEISRSQTDSLYLQGQSNILKHPEFADVQKIRALFDAFEEKIKLIRLLDKCIDYEGVRVIIGAENDNPDIQDCSIVAARYQMGTLASGVIGVIGPTRMRYQEVIELVGSAAKIIDTLFSEE